jgi:hypothetical protein
VLSRHGGAQANGRVAAAQSRLRMRNAGGRSEPFTWGNKLAGAPYFGGAVQDRRTDLTFRFLPGGGPPSEWPHDGLREALHAPRGEVAFSVWRA